MTTFTNNEKKKCIDVLKSIPEDKQKDFFDGLERHFDAIKSKRTFWGALKGLGVGIIWDMVPFSEYFTGIDDDMVTLIAITIGGWIGYRKELTENDFEKLKREVVKNEYS